VVTVGTYVAANEWDTFYEKNRITNISHWAKLPQNPNIKQSK